MIVFFFIIFLVKLMNGIFFINKEENWTSFDICAFLRRKFSTKKVGHVGTLDPFAQGLMIVCLGSATKIIPFLENHNKTYIATLKLGEETDTLDKTGKVIFQKENKDLTIQRIKEVLASFVGENKQVPPMYSALKKDGIPLYMLARDGIEIERKQRDIYIYNLDLISYEYPYLTFKAKVSKGTYIRTLGSDIAKKLNTVGYLTELTRTNIGDFSVLDAKKVKEVNETDSLPIYKMLSFLQTKVVSLEMEKDIRNGKKLSLEGDDIILLVNKNNEALAIYEKKDDFYYCKRGLFDANNEV